MRHATRKPNVQVELTAGRGWRFDFPIERLREDKFLRTGSLELKTDEGRPLTVTFDRRNGDLLQAWLAKSANSGLGGLGETQGPRFFEFRDPVLAWVSMYRPTGSEPPKLFTRMVPTIYVNLDRTLTLHFTARPYENSEPLVVTANWLAEVWRYELAQGHRRALTFAYRAHRGDERPWLAENGVLEDISAHDIERLIVWLDELEGRGLAGLNSTSFVSESYHPVFIAEAPDLDTEETYVSPTTVFPTSIVPLRRVEFNAVRVPSGFAPWLAVGMDFERYTLERPERLTRFETQPNVRVDAMVGMSRARNARVWDLMDWRTNQTVTIKLTDKAYAEFQVWLDQALSEPL